MYTNGHVSSSSEAKCIICKKRTGTYMSIDNFSRGGIIDGIIIKVPVCDGEHFDQVRKYKDVLIAFAKNINSLFR